MKKILFYILVLMSSKYVLSQSQISQFESQREQLITRYIGKLIDTNNLVYYNYESNCVFNSRGKAFYLLNGSDSLIEFNNDSIVMKAFSCQLPNTKSTRKYLKKSAEIDAYSPLGFIYYYKKSFGKEIFNFILPLSRFWGKQMKYDCFIQGIYSFTILLGSIPK